MQGKRTHRRCRSEGGAGAALAQWGALQPDLQAQGAEYAGAAHVRTASLDASASQFMESLALHDAQASQSQVPVFETSLSADQSTFSRRGHAAHAAADTWPGAAEAPATAGSKRLHESSKSCNRGSKDNMQQDGKKESMHQHKHSFTPALPAVEEMTTEDANGNDDRDEDDDEDYDSERDDGYTPRARRTSGSRCRARRGGYNGRSENELLLLDPKRVKRILANRQSAARSKERRMNYTMQLEGKLQGLSQQVDKLNAQLEGLQGRGKVLLQARADLEKQVETLQQQLRQTTTENQALVQELFGLQRSVGLPQQVPQADSPPTGYAPGQQQQQQQQVAAAASVQYDAAVQQYHRPQQQDQQQQYSQWQQYSGSGGYDAAAPPANAAGAEALQLTKSQLQYQQLQHHSRRSSNSSSGYQPSLDTTAAAAAPAGPLPAAGIPPLPPHGRSPALTTAKPASTNLPNQPGSPRIPSPPPSAAAAVKVASPALTIAAAAAASPLSSDAAAAAADVLLMDATAEAVDTDMANGDDLDMLSVLLNDSPVTDAAAAQQQQNEAATSAVQPMGPMVEQPAATAGLTSCPDATHRHPSAVSSFGPTNTVLGFNRLNCLNPNGVSHNQAAAAAAAAAARPCSWSTQSSPGAGVLAPGLPAFERLATAAANAPLSPSTSGFTPPATTGLSPPPAFRQNPGASGPLSHPRVLCSPAFSDPLGEGGFTDDVSSGSLGGILGGSLTPNTGRPRSSDSSGVAVAAAAAARLPAPALGAWQQHQQQQMVAAVSPHTPAHAAAAGSAAFSGHLAGNVAPAAAAALAPPSIQPSQQAGSILHYPHHQQQLHAAAALGPPAAPPAAAPALLQDTSCINFTMGANPAAHHRRSGSYGGVAAQHHRSASTGSMTGMAWPGSWTETAASDGNHWSMQTYGMFSSTPGAAAGGGSGISQGLGPGLPHLQQQQYVAGSSCIGGPAATGLGHHRAARLSAPSLGQMAGCNALTDASFPAAAAATASSSGFDRLAHAMHDVHSSNSRQQQHHRRSYSHAGTYATAPYAAAGGFSDQQLQLAQIHSAALGPVDAATAAALPAYGQLGRAAGSGAVGELSLPTRTVTTSSTKVRQ